MSKRYEVVDMGSGGFFVMLAKRVVETYDTETEAWVTQGLLTRETAPLLDELATKDAVILAQSERIKELMGVLKQIANISPEIEDVINGDIQTLRLFARNFSLLRYEIEAILGNMEESEDDNG